MKIPVLASYYFEILGRTDLVISQLTQEKPCSLRPRSSAGKSPSAYSSGCNDVTNRAAGFLVPSQKHHCPASQTLCC